MYQIAIIDDRLPADIAADRTDKALPGDEIRRWVSSRNWGNEAPLKSLVERITTTPLYEHKDIELIGFLHPPALLDYLSEHKAPDLVIFDWEYTTQPRETRKALIEIIERTENTFIFVYTALADRIWQLLKGPEFEENIDRLQLLLKGDNQLSLFTAEDNILQFIASQFNAAYEFDLGDNSVRFEANRYLGSPNELLFLEAILGKEVLLSALKSSNFEISDEAVPRMFGGLKIKFFLSNDGEYIFDSDVDKAERFGPLTELNFVEALQRFNVRTLDKVLERGIASTK